MALIVVPSSRERVVVALLDTLFPAISPDHTAEIPNPPYLSPQELCNFYTTRGSDLEGLALKILEAIETRLPADARRDLYTLFRLLSTRFGTLLLAGRASLNPFFPAAFPDLPLAARERVLLGWSHSTTAKFRRAFVGIKSLFLSAIFTHLDPENTSTLLNALRYTVTDPRRPLRPLPAAIAAESRVAAATADFSSCDGSKAGIARAASALAAKGLTVVWPGQGGSVDPALWRHRPAFTVAGLDAVVVGSGAGGGVTAARLAAADLKVLIIEKGPFVSAERMTQTEGESFGSMFEAGGLLTTESGAMAVLAGATLGGGTRINWSASFETPAHVRREWARSHGLGAFESAEYGESLASVARRTGIRTGFAHGRACSALAAGLTAAGLHCDDVPRNCTEPECSGHCTFGCAWGAKQDTVNTFLSDACAAGARVVVGATAERLVLRKTAKNSESRARGRFKETVGLVVTAGPAAAPLRIAIAAPTVVVCAGALHTPALLLRSGISCGGAVGSNLRLHPCVVVVGVFPSDSQVPPFLGAAGGGPAGYAADDAAGSCGSIRCSEGPNMSVFSREAADWEGSGYGVVLYNPSCHPGLFAAASPWLGGRSFKELALQYPNAVPVLVLCRDTGSGRVGVDAEGRPRLHYDIAVKDKEAMAKGMVLGLRAMAAAGATRVLTLLNDETGQFEFSNAESNVGGNTAKQRAFERYLEQVEATGVPDLRMATFSAHQMGTAALGTAPGASALDGDGETWEAAGVFCCDASTFPTSLGINPMVTIEAIAHMLAGRIAARAVAGRAAAEEAAGKKRGPVEVAYEGEGPVQMSAKL